MSNVATSLRACTWWVCVLALACGRVNSDANGPTEHVPPQDGGYDADASTGDGGYDADASTGCADERHSDLPGAALTLTRPGCLFLRSELDAGVLITAELEITSSPGPVLPFTELGAPCSPPQDEGGLVVALIIEGSGGRFCPACDVGRCRPPTVLTVPVAGTYAYSFTWHGHAWEGPASPYRTETEAPELPAGDYSLRVLAQGTREGQSFEVSAARSIRVQ